MPLFRWFKQPFSSVSWPSPSIDCSSVQPVDFPTTDAKPRPDDGVFEQVGKRTPSIMLGLGRNGADTLKQWHQQVTPKGSKLRFPIRAAIISEPSETKEEHDNGVSWLSVDVAGTRRKPPMSGERRSREQWRDGFHRSGTAQRFDEWLAQRQMEFSQVQDAQTIQVFLVASLADPAIGLLGEVLNLIHQRLRDGRLNLVVVVLLSTRFPGTRLSLSPGEQFAALREILRMKYGDFQYFPPLPDQETRVVYSPLLDYVFLLAPQNSQSDAVGASINHALAETLQLFSTSDTDVIWSGLRAAPENLENTAVQSIGIATLHIPAGAVQEYIAVRMMKTALLGENIPGYDDIGFFSPRIETGEGIAPSNLARGWLTDDNGPCPHPLFEWVLTNDSARLPRITGAEANKFNHAFRLQIAYGITTFLNERQYAGKLTLARKALAWLSEQLASRRAAIRSKIQEDLATVDNLLETWQRVADDLIEQLRKWEASIGRWDMDKGGHISSSESGQGGNPFAQLLGSPTTKSERRSKRLVEQIRQWQQQAEDVLIAECGGAVRRSLVCEKEQSLTDVDKYYYVNFLSTDANHAIRRIQERLGWWVKIDVDGRLGVHLVCVPPEKSGSEPNRYLPHHMPQFLADVREIARWQAVGVPRDLSGNWFWNRVEMNSSFLQQARKILFAYPPEESVRRLGYLFSPLADRGQHYRDKVFPPNMQPRVLDSGDPLRITALTIGIDFTPEKNSTVREMYRRYRYNSHLHIYSQEKLATEYERHLRMELGQEPFLFHPQITATLNDPQLVTLFAQALFAKLLTVIVNDCGEHYWAILPVGEIETPLWLAKGQYDDFQSLWIAYREFVVFKPFREGIELVWNPEEHFAPGQRAHFLRALHQAARHKRRQNEFPFCPQVVLSMIHEYRTRTENPVLQAFAAILALELEKPMWVGWKQL